MMALIRHGALTRPGRIGRWLMLAFLALGVSVPGEAGAESATNPALQGLSTPAPDQPPPYVSRISLGLTIGAYQPALRQINATLRTPGEVFVQDPNFLIPRNDDLPVVVRDIATPSLLAEPSYGVEAQWQWTERLSAVLMALNWQGRSEVSDVVVMSLRSNLPPVDVPRTARYNLNVNQFWLGWRYSVFDQPGKGRFYFNFGVAGYAVADYTMDAVMKVNQQNDQVNLNFASISSTEVHGTGYTSRYGAGGELFLSPHVSIGLHANYVFGELPKMRVSRYFPSGFSEIPPLPPQVTNSAPANVLPTIHAPPTVGSQLTVAHVNQVSTTVETVESPQPVLLDLNGYEVSFMLRVYY